MKRFVLGMVAVSAAFVLTGCDDLLGTFTGTLSVGEEGPAGGTIVYVDAQQEYEWDYIEAAPVDVTSDGDSEFGWTDQRRIEQTGMEIGAGRDNTARIIEIIGAERSDLTRYAAIGDDTSFSPVSYWASSEDDLTRAYAMSFSEFGGNALQSSKTNTHRIRAIRYLRETDL